MSTQIRHFLTCTAVIATQLLLAGCGARRPVITSINWPWSKDQAQAAAAPAEVHSSVAIDQSESSDSQEEANPFAKTQVDKPLAVLEAAGGIIEQDAEGRPAGVNLAGAEISTELMRAVGELQEIQWLDLRGARLSDEHLAALKPLPRLQLLALGDTQITDEGLKSIQGLNELRFLSLDRTKVSDAGLMHLAGLSNLEGVSLQGTGVTQAGAKSIESQIPGCSVIFDEDAPAESPVSTPAEPEDPFFGESIPGEPTSGIPGESLHKSRQVAQRRSHMPQRPVTGEVDVQQTRQELASLLQQKLLDPEILEALGQHLLAQRNYRQATRAFEAVLKHEPSNLRAHFGLGVTRARLGEFDAAQPHFAAVVGDATAYYNLGVIAYESQQLKQSARFFQQALGQQSDFDEARHWLAYLSRQQAVTPASHAPEHLDEQGLVSLLMSEFGRVSSPPPADTQESEIQIIPGRSSASPKD